MDVLSFFLTLLSLIVNLLQLKYNGSNMYEQHPELAGTAVTSLILYCFVLWIELKYPLIYQTYLASVQFVVSFLGCLSMASTISLLVPSNARPLVFIVSLVIPVMKALYWIFKKMDEEFGETEFWRRNLGPVVSYMRRRLRRANILPY